MFLCPFCIFFTKRRCQYFFDETISVYFLTRWKEPSPRRCQNRSCDEQQSSKRIDSHFVWCLLCRKRRTGFQSNGGTGHFILCETKPNNLSMLCMTICPCRVWQFVYFVYDNLSMLCMTYFDYSFLSILCMSLSLTSNFSI